MKFFNLVNLEVFLNAYKVLGPNRWAGHHQPVICKLNLVIDKTVDICLETALDGSSSRVSVNMNILEYYRNLRRINNIPLVFVGKTPSYSSNGPTGSPASQESDNLFIVKDQQFDRLHQYPLEYLPGTTIPFYVFLNTVIGLSICGLVLELLYENPSGPAGSYCNVPAPICTELELFHAERVKRTFHLVFWAPTPLLPNDLLVKLQRSSGLSQIAIFLHFQYYRNLLLQTFRSIYLICFNVVVFKVCFCLAGYSVNLAIKDLVSNQVQQDYAMLLLIVTFITALALGNSSAKLLLTAIKLTRTVLFYCCDQIVKFFILFKNALAHVFVFINKKGQLFIIFILREKDRFFILFKTKPPGPEVRSSR